MPNPFIASAVATKGKKKAKDIFGELRKLKGGIGDLKQIFDPASKFDVDPDDFTKISALDDALGVKKRRR